MPLQLFPIHPPRIDLGLTVRELVAGGALIQRELIDQSAFESRARERGIASFESGLLERWDRDGVLSPLAFVRGPWGSWRTTEPYPVEGIVFREEEGFHPWEEYAYERWEYPHVTALYSEWQLLYVTLAYDGENLMVPLETLLADAPAAATFASNHRPFVDQHARLRGGLQEAWLPTIMLLLRLQTRHWPFVHGSSVMLIDPQSKDYVDALDLEYQRVNPEQLRVELNLDPDALETTYRWLAGRAQRLDPLPRLYEVRRLQPRDEREAERGAARQSLDLYDTADVVRRGYRELTGELLPDADQLDYPELVPRPFLRDRDQLRAALRHQRLYPHRLHMVVEGETDLRLIVRLFEAFAGRAWDGAGLVITDLGGDKLEGTRTKLDNENDAERVAHMLSRDGVLAPEHTKLWERSLEEDNFTPQELLDMVATIGAEAGATLTLDVTTLLQAQESRNQGGGRRKGLASVLQQLARDPLHGSVVFTKPRLADQMANLLMEEIREAPGGHEEVATRRPIVRWVLSYPLRAHQQS